MLLFVCLQSTIQCIQRTQDLMWCQENILSSWPEKLPSFTEEMKTGRGVNVSSVARQSNVESSLSVQSLKTGKTTMTTKARKSSSTVPKSVSSSTKVRSFFHFSSCYRCAIHCYFISPFIHERILRIVRSPSRNL